jgi:two-component system chemotaxis response regulator CheB
VSIADLGPLLVRLTAAPATVEHSAVPERLEVEVNIAKDTNAVDAGVTKIGEPSTYACPDCHGVLLEIKEAGRIRFRCHTGHAYSAESLIAAVDDALEEAMWNAIRALEEAGLLMNRMAEHFKDSHDPADARRLADRGETARRQSDAIRQLASQREPATSKS